MYDGETLAVAFCPRKANCSLLLMYGVTGSTKNTVRDTITIINTALLEFKFEARPKERRTIE